MGRWVFSNTEVIKKFGEVPDDAGIDCANNYRVTSNRAL
jgi:hypothetical protein